MTPLIATAALITLALYGVACLLVLWRALRGPAAPDRVLALDLITVIAALAILVLGLLFATTSLFEVALLIALFGFVGSTAMAKFLLRGEVIE